MDLIGNIVYKLQRLVCKDVHPSGWKWRAPRKEDDDIVSTSIVI